MPDWLNSSFEDSVGIDWKAVVTRLVVSFMLGAAIAGIYRGTRRRKEFTESFPATLVLLCILIALVTQVIGNNVARAFSLVGALSIVRFRTVVRDTKDTAFVIFSVVVGMAVGAGLQTVALCGLIVTGAAAALYRDRLSRAVGCSSFLVVVRMAWAQGFEADVAEAISRHSSSVALVRVCTIRHGTALEISHRVGILPTSAPTQLLADLHRVEGVQDVELHCAEEDD